MVALVAGRLGVLREQIAGTYVTVDPVSSLAISDAYDGDAPRQAREMFESFMRGHDVPQGAQEPAVYSYGWPRMDAAEDIYIGSYGRTFDLIVLGRPGRAPQDPRMPPLEAALFDSGRPVLIAPPSAPKTIGRNVLVAWNASIEQARTNAAAGERLYTDAEMRKLASTVG